MKTQEQQWRFKKEGGMNEKIPRKLDRGGRARGRQTGRCLLESKRRKAEEVLRLRE